MSLIARIKKFFAGPEEYPAIDRLQQVVHHAPWRGLVSDFGPVPNPDMTYLGLVAQGAAFPVKPPSYESSLRLPNPISKKQALLIFIKAYSPKGITVEELAQAFPAWRYSTISARISELYKAGSIVAVGTTTTSTGALGKLYAVAQEG